MLKAAPLPNREAQLSLRRGLGPWKVGEVKQGGGECKPGCERKEGCQCRGQEGKGVPTPGPAPERRVAHLAWRTGLAGVSFGWGGSLWVSSRTEQRGAGGGQELCYLDNKVGGTGLWKA